MLQSLYMTVPTTLLFICLKIRVIDMFKVFVTVIENQFNKRIKRLCSDRGTEYD